MIMLNYSVLVGDLNCHLVLRFVDDSVVAGEIDTLFAHISLLSSIRL